MTKTYLRCHASECHRLFVVDADATSDLLEAARFHEGLKLSCPACRLTYLYRSDELVLPVDPERLGRPGPMRHGPVIVLA
ncbi:MAG: hypothetical protein L3J91_00615 [Thermoplasmata archaeon]|nr:hypothetical protein [Thermoplasmata archaeon]